MHVGRVAHLYSLEGQAPRPYCSQVLSSKASLTLAELQPFSTAPFRCVTAPAQDGTYLSMK